MSPVHRLKRRVGRFRYFKRSEYNNLLDFLGITTAMSDDDERVWQ